MKDKKNELKIKNKNDPRGNFNKDFKHQAVLTNIPWPARVSPKGENEAIDSPKERVARQLTLIKEAREKNGLILAGFNLLTDPELLAGLASCNSILMVDKDSFNTSLIRDYNKIIAGYTCDQLPGNYFPHYKSIVEEDHGYIDGVRVIGEHFENLRKRANETRPLFHWKIMILLLPHKKLILAPAASIDGTANGTPNSKMSLERVWYTEDPKLLQYQYDLFAWAWGHTEGLFNYRRSATPMFQWKKTVTRFSPLPLCQCGHNAYAPHWHMFDGDSEHTHVFRCLHCNNLISMAELPWD